MNKQQAQLQIDVNKLRSNIDKFQAIKPAIGIVKANAYGHGGVQVAKILIEQGVQYLAVATIDEAIELRQGHIEQPIIVLGYIDELNLAKEHNLTVVINNPDKILNNPNEYDSLTIHLNYDTGMNRNGIKDVNDVKQIIDNAQEYNYKLEGFFSHIHAPEHQEESQKQIKQFEGAYEEINYDFPMVHLLASVAAFKYECNICTHIRPGIGLYGCEVEELALTSKLVSRVEKINIIQPGEYIGYTTNFIANKQQLVAIVPGGYGDGIMRSHLNSAVLIKGQKYQLAGNVTMDYLLIAVDENVQVGDEVEIYYDLNIQAVENGTITNELITQIAQRVPRKFIEEK